MGAGSESFSDSWVVIVPESLELFIVGGGGLMIIARKACKFVVFKALKNQ